MTRHRKHVARVALCCAMAVSGIAAASAQSVEQFYKGRNLTLIVGFAPGGINDISGRLVGRHLGRFIPGHPNIIVQNMPGAGGLATANRLYNVAEKDGSVIAGIGRSVPQLAIQGNPNASFDPQKFTWLGSLSSYANDAYLLTVIARHPAKTVADINKPGMTVTLGTDRAGASNVVFALISKEVLALNVNLVRGYQGAAPIFLAMQSGEVDGQVIGFSSIKAGQRDLWNRKELRPLVQFGRLTRLPELPDVPTGRELAAEPKAQALLEFAELPFFMALPFVAPPDVPADRAAALKAAFMAMCKDEAFVEDAKRLGLDVSPIDGAAIGKLLARSAATPKDVIERYNAIEKN
jgi:tripartite-type tricarboxylate transporter receptor subunit TctC